MTERNQVRDAERLPEEAARRLLQRASELEAARNTSLSVAELREAASEAGITAAAFDQALAELQASQASSAVVPTTRRRRLAPLAVTALTVMGLLSMLLVLRLMISVG
jgi:hypothetical protein